MSGAEWSRSGATALARRGGVAARSGERLRSYACVVLDRAQQLGCGTDEPAGDDLDALHDALDAALQEIGRALVSGRRPAVREQLVALLAAAAELRQELGARDAQLRLDAIAGASEALRGLRATSDPGELLGRLPQEICLHAQLGRCLVARVDGDRWITAHAMFDAGAQNCVSVEEFRARRLSVEASPLEGEIVRRRAAVLTGEPMVPAWLAAKPSPPPHVAAPVLVADRVIAFVYADRGEPVVDQRDRDTVAWFADGAGDLLERAALTRRLCAQRDHVRRLAATAGTVMDELHLAEIELPAAKAHDAERTGALIAAPTVSPGRSLESLTRREMEVLALMAAGANNGAIARELVIAEGTAKSHVKHILRKLGAANRAEAVARYLRRFLGDPDDLVRA